MCCGRPLGVIIDSGRLFGQFFGRLFGLSFDKRSVSGSGERKVSVCSTTTAKGETCTFVCVERSVCGRSIVNYVRSSVWYVNWCLIDCPVDNPIDRFVCIRSIVWYSVGNGSRRRGVSVSSIPISRRYTSSCALLRLRLVQYWTSGQSFGEGSSGRNCRSMFGRPFGILSVTGRAAGVLFSKPTAPR